MFNTSSGAETVSIAVGGEPVWPVQRVRRAGHTRSAVWGAGHERSAVNVQET